MPRNKSALVLFATCAIVAACNTVQNKEDMLAAAGFKSVPRTRHSGKPH